MTDNELLLAIHEQLKGVNKRFDAIDERLDAMDKRFDAMDGRFDKVDKTLDVIKYKQDYMAEKLKGIEATMNYNDYNLSHDVKILREDVDTLAEILKAHCLMPVS